MCEYRSFVEACGCCYRIVECVVEFAVAASRGVVSTYAASGSECGACICITRDDGTRGVCVCVHEAECVLARCSCMVIAHFACTLTLACKD